MSSPIDFGAEFRSGESVKIKTPPSSSSGARGGHLLSLGSDADSDLLGVSLWGYLHLADQRVIREKKINKSLNYLAQATR